MVKSSIIDSFLGLDDAPEYSDVCAAETQTYLEQDGVSVELEPPYGSGAIDYVRINDSLVLALAHFQATDRENLAVVGKHKIKFNFQLQGSGYFRASKGNAAFHTMPMTGGVMLHPAGLEKVESYPANQAQVSATISCDADYLAALLGPDMEVLQRPLRRFLHTGDADFFYTDLPLTLDMMTATRALLESSYHGRLRKIHAEAKVLDLLCQFCRRLAESVSSHSRNSTLSARDRERVEAARLRLEQCFAKPPTILSLAHDLATNETKLSSSFKQVIGTTIFDYIQTLRMERARHLLMTSDLSVTQIAYDVGYDYPGNFATAFKRHYGVTPRRARGNGAAVQARIPPSCAQYPH